VTLAIGIAGRLYTLSTLSASCCQSLHSFAHDTHDHGATISRHASDVDQGHALTVEPGHLNERNAAYPARNCSWRTPPSHTVSLTPVSNAIHTMLSNASITGGVSAGATAPIAISERHGSVRTTTPPVGRDATVAYPGNWLMPITTSSENAMPLHDERAKLGMLHSCEALRRDTVLARSAIVVCATRRPPSDKGATPEGYQGSSDAAQSVVTIVSTV